MQLLLMLNSESYPLSLLLLNVHVRVLPLKIIIVVIRQWLSRRLCKLRLILLNNSLINFEIRRLKSGRFNEYKLIIPTQLPGQPQKGFLKVVITLGGNVVILQIFLAMECDLLGFDFTIFDFDLVSGQDDGDVLAYAG